MRPFTSIDRAFSSWNMEIQTKRESLPFAECIERELTTMMGERRTYGTAEYHFVQRGFYMDQIERFQKHFPDRFCAGLMSAYPPCFATNSHLRVCISHRGQMLIVIAERLRADPVTEYSRVVEFIGARCPIPSPPAIA